MDKLKRLKVFVEILIVDLTPEEQLILQDIRKRKLELLAEIEQLQAEIDAVSKDIGRVPLAEHEDNVSIDSTDSKDAKLMSLGCKKFNMDPKKGIEFLVLHGRIKKEEEDVAQVRKLIFNFSIKSLIP
jgi:cytohesin